MQGGGVRVNNEKISDVEYRLEEKDLIEGRLVLIAAGKKNKLLLHVEWHILLWSDAGGEAQSSVMEMLECLGNSYVVYRSDFIHYN